MEGSAVLPGLDVDALRSQAEVLFRRGRVRLAIPLLEMAVGARPEDAALLADLARALYFAGESQAAVDAYDRALRCEPDSPKSRVRRGVALLDLGRTSKALDDIRAAVRAQPRDAERHFSLANALLDSGDVEAAAQSYAVAVELEPEYAKRHYAWGFYYATVGQTERAVRMYRWGLALNPSDALLEHSLAALEGGETPTRSSDEYLTRYFDDFADDFDEVLLDKLDYQAPKVLASVAERVILKESAGRLRVLDAGCGTGLCGPLVRPLAGRLEGTDLSPRMLEHARTRACYDELRAVEITEDMAGRPDHYDLVVAADVLIYFGDLTDLFRAFATSLRPGGLAVVSAERHDEPGYVLTPSGRYAHEAAYLRTTAEAAGLEPAELGEFRLRQEMGAPVAGYFCVLRRPESSA